MQCAAVRMCLHDIRVPEHPLFKKTIALYGKYSLFDFGTVKSMIFLLILRCGKAITVAFATFNIPIWNKAAKKLPMIFLFHFCSFYTLAVLLILT